MRLQLVSLITFHLFVVVDVNRRMLINWKKTILMTANGAPPAADDASVHSRMSNHQSMHSNMSHRQSSGTKSAETLHRHGNVAYSFNSSRGSILFDGGSSEHRQKRASELNEQGMQISPVLALKVTDAFNRPLMSSQGPTELRVGDYVRFIISLTRDGIYDSLEVMSCTMSTSYTMPDPKAETRVLLVKGCPIPDEATADSWFWTSEMSTNTTFISNTQAVPIFRLSSEYIYLHCSMKMCFIGYEPCHQPTRENCIVMDSKRKKRDDFLPMRRRRSESVDGVTDVNQTLALRVIDPKLSPTSNNPFEVGTWGFVALIVLISLIGLVVIILLIILVVILLDRRPNRRRRSQPQQFAQQRVTPTTTNRKCLTCCC